MAFEYKRFYINIDVPRLTDPSYVESLKQQILCPARRDRGLSYQIRYNEFFTERVAGAFTEHSLTRVLEHIEKTK